MSLKADHPLIADRTAESRLVRAYRGERPDITPVWFMRQAGRSLPEYRALRQGGDMLQACLTPELASEITMQPVRRHGVDAAIFFSDIVIPLKLVGLDVQIVPGRGPVFAEPANTPEAIAKVTSIDPGVVVERAAPVREAVQRTTSMLAELSTGRGEPLPLIGFAGAPFTLAAYLIEGGPSKDHMAARALMHQHPAAWRQLMGWIADVTGLFLAEQVAAGASAAQLFDSWAGSLSAADYHEHSRWASEQALEPVQALRWADDVDVPATGISGPGAQGAVVPLIHFGVGTGELLADMALPGVDAVGVDYRIPLSAAVRRIPSPVTVQGNLDPALLFAGHEAITAAADVVLTEGLAARAHVFNLGHGVPADADPDELTALVRYVHDWRAGADA